MAMKCSCCGVMPTVHDGLYGDDWCDGCLRSWSATGGCDEEDHFVNVLTTLAGPCRHGRLRGLRRCEFCEAEEKPDHRETVHHLGDDGMTITIRAPVWLGRAAVIKGLDMEPAEEAMLLAPR